MARERKTTMQSNPEFVSTQRKRDEAKAARDAAATRFRALQDKQRPSSRDVALAVYESGEMPVDRDVDIEAARRELQTREAVLALAEEKLQKARQAAAEAICQSVMSEYAAMNTEIIEAVCHLADLFHKEIDFVEALSNETGVSFRGWLKAINWSQASQLPRALRVMNVPKFLRDNKAGK